MLTTLAKMLLFHQSNRSVVEMSHKNKNGELLKKIYLKAWISLEFYSMVTLKMLTGTVLNWRSDKQRKERSIKVLPHFRFAQQ